MNERYYSFKKFLNEKFPGKKIRKIPLNAGFNCPNKDGTISNKGCIFCDQYGSGPVKTFDLPVREQIENFMKNRPDNYFISYFQAHTNTSGEPLELLELYRTALEYERVIGIFAGTRPDAIPENVFPVLKQINEETWFSIELGLQSIHEKSLKYLRRNHTYDQFLEKFAKLKDSGIEVVVHLILGIPGENFEDMKKTVLEMNRIKPAGIKFHMLHVLKNTELFKLYESGVVKLFEKNEYVETIVRLIEYTDPSIVIHRITGERERELFHAPVWALNKSNVISAIRSEMTAGNSFQGKRLLKQ